MANKNIYSRMQQKHDIQANWEKAVNFIPLEGEIIIYDPDENNSNSRIKIGDGKTKINDLDFIESGNYVISPTAPKDTSVLWIDISEEEQDKLVKIDTTLSLSGQAADAKVVGEKMSEKSQVQIITWGADD